MSGIPMSAFDHLKPRPEDYTDTQAISLDGSIIPEGIPEEWIQLIDTQQKIREVWDGTKPYPSDSERAFAIANHAGFHGLTKEKTAAVLKAFYAEPGRKNLHKAKLEHTLGAWEEGRQEAQKTRGGRIDGRPPEPYTEEMPAEAPETDLPTFPEAAYQGLAAEIAHTYSERLESPTTFFYIDILAYLGALTSRMVRLDSELREEPRIYGAKVGPSAISRKSSGQETTDRFFAPILQDRVVTCYGVGSAEGLQQAMKSGLPTLLVYDELRAFVDKAGIQQSVLLPMVAQLFHRTVYETRTKNSEIRLTDAHLSLIGSCTIETFTTMFTPAFRNIGFLNRLFVVTGKREKLHPIPAVVPSDVVKRLQDQTLAQIEKAERDRPALRFTADALRRWKEFYYAIPESPYASRLDTYGLRFLMLFAVTTESWQITRPLVDAVIPLLDYQLAIRRELDPVDAEGVVARMERLIHKHLGKGRMPDNRLQTLCNVRYYGLWAYDLALRNLMGQEWVRTQRAGRGRQLWLTDRGREALSQ